MHHAGQLGAVNLMLRQPIGIFLIHRHPQHRTSVGKYHPAASKFLLAEYKCIRIGSNGRRKLLLGHAVKTVTIRA